MTLRSHLSAALPPQHTNLCPLELKLLGNILANDRMAGVTESDQEMRFALGRLIQLGLVTYKPQRERQKFNITHKGRAVYDHERTRNIVGRSLVDG